MDLVKQCKFVFVCNYYYYFFFQFVEQPTLTSIAQTVVDKVVRLHHDNYLTKQRNVTTRDDITLIIRNFNFPLRSALTPSAVSGGSSPRPPIHHRPHLRTAVRTPVRFSFLFFSLCSECATFSFPVIISNNDNNDIKLQNTKLRFSGFTKVYQQKFQTTDCNPLRCVSIFLCMGLSLNLFIFIFYYAP